MVSAYVLLRVSLLVCMTMGFAFALKVTTDPSMAATVKPAIWKRHGHHLIGSTWVRAR